MEQTINEISYSEAKQKALEPAGLEFMKTCYGFTENDIKSNELGYDPDHETLIISADGKSEHNYISYDKEGKPANELSQAFAEAWPYKLGYAMGNASVEVVPCVICESYVDALSIMCAAGNTCRATAIEGKGYKDILRYIKKMKELGHTIPPLLIDYADDEDGRKRRNHIIDGLRQIGVPYKVLDHAAGFIFTRDGFKADRKAFTENLQANIKQAERICDMETADRLAKLKAHNGAEMVKGFNEQVKRSVNLPAISTGYANLDKVLKGGLRPGLYIMGAVSSMGKTTFLLQMCDQIAAQGVDVLYFSLEMATNELIAKSISRETYLHCNGYTNLAKDELGISEGSEYKKYSQEEKDLIAEAKGAYSEYSKNLYYYEGVGDYGIEDIKQIITDHITLTGHKPVVAIDYLQILQPYDMKATDKQNTDKAVLELKRLSRDKQLPVLAISSFNRDSYKEKISMAAFKESGAIEYTSDVLIGLEPQGMSDNAAHNAALMKKAMSADDKNLQLRLLKNRKGRRGDQYTAAFIYHAKYNCFTIDDGFRPAKEGETPEDFEESDE